jgi:hypothetical protein
MLTGLDVSAGISLAIAELAAHYRLERWRSFATAGPPFGRDAFNDPPPPTINDRYSASTRSKITCSSETK